MPVTVIGDRTIKGYDPDTPIEAIRDRLALSPNRQPGPIVEPDERRARIRMNIKPWLPVVSSLVLLAAAPRVAAQTAAAPEPDIVVTSGRGNVGAAPDRATFTVTVETRARQPRDAQKQNSATMTVVREKLLGAGLTADVLRTLAYDLQPEFDYTNNKQTLRGYVARNTLEVRVNQMDRAGELIDVAVQSGATSVGNVQFDLKDTAPIVREALQKAVADARGRAEAIAGAAGRSIERVISIRESGAAVPIPRRMQRMSAPMEAAAAPSPPPMEPGELQIEANITLTVKLK